MIHTPFLPPPSTAAQLPSPRSCSRPSSRRSWSLGSLALAALALAPPSLAATKDTDKPLPERLQGHLELLTSDELEGRLTGSAGELTAADYLAGQLEQLGVRPLIGDSFVVPFEFTAGSRDTGSSLSLTVNAEEPTRWNGVDTVQALSFSDVGEISGELVFAGYGIRVPQSSDFGYDSFATLDVEDKIVVVMRYFPEDAEGDARATLARYSGPRYKAMTARQLGAKALIVITGPRSPNAGKVMPMTFDTAIAGWTG